MNTNPQTTMIVKSDSEQNNNNNNNKLLKFEDGLLTLVGSSSCSSSSSGFSSGSEDKMLNGREARNRAEKNRRDKLNGSIQELTTMVPHVAESPRRVDKTAVLRYAAHGLRLQYVFKDSLHRKPTKPMFVTDILMKLVDSFMIGITCHGQIVLITASVEQHLGHCQTDLYGQNITQITHPDDHNILKKELMPQDLDTLFDIQPDDDSGEPRPRTAEEEEEIDKRLREDRRTFTIRMSRAVPRSEAPCYEIVKIDGCFRRADSAPRGVKTSTFQSGMQLIRRARGRDESFQLHNISGNDIIFVGMARVVQPPKIHANFTKGNLFEYKTRHLIDGRIVDCDTRISLVAGYMPGEVKDLSPFSFMHEDDVRWVIVALRQMYDNSSDFGESCYRLVGRNGKFVYLRSRGFLEFDENMKNVRSFICVNTMISEEEGRQALLEMKNRFAIMVNVNSDQPGITSSNEDCLASENPHQLEKAVLCLIKDLPNGSDDSFRSKGNGRNGNGERNSRTPPVSYIPPDSEAVKSSISKSVSIIYEKIGIGKQFRQSCSPSPSSIKSPSSQSSPSSDEVVFEEQKQQTQTQLQQNRPSVLQTVSTATPSKVQIKQEYMSRVPPLPNNTCDCYFNNNEGCTKCSEPVPTNSLKRPCDYLSDSGDSAGDDRKKCRTTPPLVCEDSPQSAYQLSHSDQRIIDIENDRRNFNMPTSEQLQLEEILDQDISADQPNVLVNIKSENESSPASTSSSVRSPMNNMYYLMNNENDLKPR
ncbi:hypothetical protein ACFFRR_002634 [Megaselia abdita]